MKNKRMTFSSKYAVAILVTMITLGAFISACKKDDDDGGAATPTTGYMQMEMTDSPGNYLHVYVDVKSVAIHRSDDADPSGWVVLNTRDTIYDLLTLQNDITAVLADSTLLPTGKVTQLRLVLGTNNTVVLNDSSVHDLTIPSSQQSGIKINLNTTIEPNRTTRVLIDFDAGQSINLQGNGEYKLGPVIKVKKIVVE